MLFASCLDPKEDTFGTGDTSRKNEAATELKHDSFKIEPQITSDHLPPLNQLPAFKPSGGSKWTCR